MTGKDYFDKFLKSTSTVASTTTPIKCTNVGLNLTNQELSNATPDPSILNTSLPGSPVPCKESTELESKDIAFIRNFDKISLWNTRILKTVVPTRMVWAPYYRFRNKMFCARLCENDEIERDPYIKTPLSDGECVVEFICAPKTEKEDTKLLKVYKKDVIPFYGKSMKCSSEDSSPAWCPKLVDKMHQAIKEKCNKIDTEYIFNTIITAAREYLIEALEFENAMKIALAKQQSPQRSLLLSSTNSNNTIISSPVGGRLLPPRTDTDNQPVTLEIGDFIRYASEIQNDILVYAKITGFSKDYAAPLLLNNHAQLHLNKRICKMAKVPLSENSLGYDPSSGKYRTLKDCQLLRPPADDALDKDNGNQVKSVITEEDHNIITAETVKKNNMKSKNVIVSSQETSVVGNPVSNSSKKRKTPIKTTVAKAGTQSVENDVRSLVLFVDSPPLMNLPSSQCTPLRRQQQSMVSSPTSSHPPGNNVPQSSHKRKAAADTVKQESELSPRDAKAMKTDSSTGYCTIGSSGRKLRNSPSAVLDKTEEKSPSVPPTGRSSRSNSAKKASSKGI